MNLFSWLFGADVSSTASEPLFNTDGTPMLPDGSGMDYNGHAFGVTEESSATCFDASSTFDSFSSSGCFETGSSFDTSSSFDSMSSCGCDSFSSW